MPTTDLRDYTIQIQKTTTTGYYFPREEMSTTGPYHSQPKLIITINHKDEFHHDSGLQFKSSLGDAIQHFEDELDEHTLKVIDYPSLLEPLEFNSTDWGEAFLKQTIEGQQILERIITDHTNFTAPAKLPYIKNSDENITTTEELTIHHQMELQDGDRWEQEKDELDKYVENIDPLEDVDLNQLDLKQEDHTYIIRFIDTEWNHWLYIGKSKNIINKLQTQICQGGTFKEADRTRMEAISIEEIKSGNIKGNLYKQATDKYDVPERRIAGVYL